MPKLGTIALGGPAVHVAMLRDETVRRRAGWAGLLATAGRGCPAPAWPRSPASSASSAWSCSAAAMSCSPSCAATWPTSAAGLTPARSWTASSPARSPPAGVHHRDLPRLPARRRPRRHGLDRRDLRAVVCDGRRPGAPDRPHPPLPLGRRCPGRHHHGRAGSDGRRHRRPWATRRSPIRSPPWSPWWPYRLVRVSVVVGTLTGSLGRPSAARLAVVSAAAGPGAHLSPAVGQREADLHGEGRVVGAEVGEEGVPARPCHCDCVLPVPARPCTRRPLSARASMTRPPAGSRRGWRALAHKG
jgi:hypothetical protein